MKQGRVSPQVSEGALSCQHLMSGIWLPELWNDKLPLFWAIQFVVACFRSSRNLIWSATQLTSPDLGFYSIYSGCPLCTTHSLPPGLSHTHTRSKVTQECICGWTDFSLNCRSHLALTHAWPTQERRGLLQESAILFGWTNKRSFWKT